MSLSQLSDLPVEAFLNIVPYLSGGDIKMLESFPRLKAMIQAHSMYVYLKLLENDYSVFLPYPLQQSSEMMYTRLANENKTLKEYDEWYDAFKNVLLTQPVQNVIAYVKKYGSNIIYNQHPITKVTPLSVVCSSNTPDLALPVLEYLMSKHVKLDCEYLQKESVLWSIKHPVILQYMILKVPNVTTHVKNGGITYVQSLILYNNVVLLDVYLRMIPTRILHAGDLFRYVNSPEVLIMLIQYNVLQDAISVLRYILVGKSSAMFQRADIIQALVLKQGNINVLLAGTPLLIQVYLKSMVYPSLREVVFWLLTIGADPNLPDQDGKTLMDYQSQFNDEELALWFNNT